MRREIYNTTRSPATPGGLLPVEQALELSGHFFEIRAEVADALAGFPLNQEQEDYLEAAALLLEEHEDTRSPRISVQPFLRQLCLENDISVTALSKIPGASRLLGSVLPSGDRNISAEHASAIDKQCKLDPSASLCI